MARRPYPLVRAPLPPADQPAPRLVRRIEQLAARAWNEQVLVDGVWTGWQTSATTVTYSLSTALTGFSGAINAASTAFGNLASVNWGTMTMGTGGTNVITYDNQIPYYDVPPRTGPPVMRTLTPEEEADRAARLLRQQQQRRDRIAAQESARTRARNTLLEFLTPEQRTEYEAHDHFVCTGSEGNRYRIERGSAGNVVYLDERGEAAGRLCAHPSMSEHWLPDQDVALAQMLALMTDERNFVRIANVHRGRAPEFDGAVLLDRSG